jgi:hypothetical protein
MRFEWAAELERLASRPFSLSDRRDPERPHVRLSEWRQDMRRLAARIRAGEPVAVVNGSVNVLDVRRRVLRDETADL